MFLRMVVSTTVIRGELIAVLTLVHLTPRNEKKKCQGYCRCAHEIVIIPCMYMKICSFLNVIFYFCLVFQACSGGYAYSKYLL